MDMAGYPDAPLERGDPDYEAGLTAKWGITPDLILNGAYNPDFSQVEADVAQLEINRRFALFYPEKRPFFLEGADFFLTPLQAVFTRTVADPLWGAKLTGKIGPHGHGLFRRRGHAHQPPLPLEPGDDAGFARSERDRRRLPAPPGYRQDVDAGRPLHRPRRRRLLQPCRRGRRLLPARRQELDHLPVPALGDGLPPGRRGGLRPGRGPVRRRRLHAGVPAFLAPMDHQRGLRRQVAGLPGRLRVRPPRRYADRPGHGHPPVLGQAQGLVQSHPSRRGGASRLGPRRAR